MPFACNLHFALLSKCSDIPTLTSSFLSHFLPPAAFYLPAPSPDVNPDPVLLGCLAPERRLSWLSCSPCLPLQFDSASLVVSLTCSQQV